jgi:hypothetical protein
MANTRNRGANDNENNNNNANNPPPPPTLEQVLIMQAQMLQTMQQTMANMQQAQGISQHLSLSSVTNLGNSSGLSPQHPLTPSNSWTQMIG